MYYYFPSNIFSLIDIRYWNWNVSSGICYYIVEFYYLLYKFYSLIINLIYYKSYILEKSSLLQDIFTKSYYLLHKKRVKLKGFGGFWCTRVLITVSAIFPKMMQRLWSKLKYDTLQKLELIVQKYKSINSECLLLANKWSFWEFIKNLKFLYYILKS